MKFVRSILYASVHTNNHFTLQLVYFCLLTCDRMTWRTNQWNYRNEQAELESAVFLLKQIDYFEWRNVPWRFKLFFKRQISSVFRVSTVFIWVFRKCCRVRSCKTSTIHTIETVFRRTRLLHLSFMFFISFSFPWINSFRWNIDNLLFFIICHIIS